MVPLNEVARRLALDPKFAKGLIVGRRVRIDVVGNSHAISESSLARLEVFLVANPYPRGRGGRPRSAAAPP